MIELHSAPCIVKTEHYHNINHAESCQCHPAVAHVALAKALLGSFEIGSQDGIEEPVEVRSGLVAARSGTSFGHPKIDGRAIRIVTLHSLAALFRWYLVGLCQQSLLVLAS
eukprot:6193074-Pleurochrysis_carterae.AAC.9